MRKLAEITYQGIEEDKKYQELIDKVYEACFKEEDLYDYDIYISVIIASENYIKAVNSTYRKIDEVTDVLSFPMFEKNEIEEAKHKKEVLGDVIICIKRVEEQAEKYGHGFEREFAYMLVHGFYHLMGYDHIEEKDKKSMRLKEENVLSKIELKHIINR